MFLLLFSILKIGEKIAANDQVLFLCLDKMNPGACLLLFRGYIPGICLWPLFLSVFPEIAWLIKIKFYMDLLRKRMLTFLLNGLSHITKMAAYTIKNLNNWSPMTLTFSMRLQGLKQYKACLNDDPGFTFSETIGPLEAKITCWASLGRVNKFLFSSM